MPTGSTVEHIPVKAGETVQFEVTNTAGFGHNFYIGPEEVLSTVTGNIPDGNGIPEFTEGTETLRPGPCPPTRPRTSSSRAPCPVTTARCTATSVIQP